MKVAHLDGMGSISGEMFLGALLDAGLDVELLKGTLDTLSLESLRLKLEQGAIGQTQGIRLSIDEEWEQQLAPREIKEIIQGTNLSREVGRKCGQIYEDLTATEDARRSQGGRDHVGIARSIFTIVGTVFGLDTLGVNRISSSSWATETSASESTGDVSAEGAHWSGVEGTPLGVALIRGLVTHFGPLPALTVQRVGYGLGEQNRPDLLRVTIGHDPSDLSQDMISLMEVTLNDTNPEWLGFLMDRLLAAGALDVVYVPVQLDRSRPGILLQIMSRPHLGDDLRTILSKEGVGHGIRFHVSRRCFLQRELLEVDSPWGKIEVKKVLRPNAAHAFLPEYEACREVARTSGLPLQELYRWVMSLNRS